MKKITIYDFSGLFFIILAGYMSLQMQNEYYKSGQEVPAEVYAGSNAAGAVSLNPGDYRFLIRQGEIDRFYLVHVPEKYNKVNVTPLVMAFHGAGGDSVSLAKYDNFRLIAKSDEEGFIVAFPNGSTESVTGKLATWNAGRCCGYSTSNNMDDVGFVKAVLGDIKSKFNIDNKRIYATGFSNGGMFSYRLACDMSDTFAAIAAVAGTDNYDRCRAEKPIPVLHIHALNDQMVPFGETVNGKETWMTKYLTSVPKTISRWIERNGCVEGVKTILKTEGAYCRLHPNSVNGAEVKLCVTEEGGHSWPGGVKGTIDADAPTDAISAADQIWNFFKANPRL